MAYLGGPSNGGVMGSSLQLNTLTSKGGFNPNEWRNWPFVKVWVRGLPENITTFDLHSNFSRYGWVDHIYIKSSNTTGGGTWAEVTFKLSESPLMHAFWDDSHITLRRENGATPRLRVQLSNRQQLYFRTKSKSIPDLYYPSEITVLADTIDFGVEPKEGTFMRIRTLKSQPKHPVQLVLRLDHNELSVQFPCDFKSTRASLVRDYRFNTSLDGTLSISKVQEDEGFFSLLLRLDRPPPYTKQLRMDSRIPHDDESNTWREADMWMRQTTFTLSVKEMMDIRNEPVKLQDSHHSFISLGRWTKYLLKIPKAEQNMEHFRMLKTATEERNVSIASAPGICVISQTDEFPLMWEVLKTVEDLNISRSTSGGQFLSLPFDLRYLLDVCVSNGYLSEYNLRADFFEALANMSPGKAQGVLNNMVSSRLRYDDPLAALFSVALQAPRKPSKLSENSVPTYSAIVTATTLIINPPSIEPSNRIMRKYRHVADRFLRIRFEDDEYRGNSRIYATTSHKLDEIFVRIKRTLLKGIEVGGRRYKFLAWGNSQLREHGAYFFADTDSITASDIRERLGHFEHETIIAKRAARMGQCFSTTQSIPGRLSRVTHHELIEDIERLGPNGKLYNFSDGVGKISPVLAAQVSMQLKLIGHAPSAYQFRFGGCKGILVVDPDLKGRCVRIRKSQYKFPSDSEGLEIIRSSEFWNAHLNQQLILVLSALGVPDSTFLEMQTAEMRALEVAMDDDSAAIEALYDCVDANRMTPLLADFVRDGFRTSRDPFVTSLLHLWRAWSLQYLKDKAHIRVPQGALIMGCVDEKGRLKGYFESRKPIAGASLKENEKLLPEIFVQVTDPRTGKPKVITGLCAVARNPSLHIGDVRVCRAIDEPELHGLRDVVVFPKTGDKDLPGLMSGGDLDGDDYIVIWDQKLLPTNWAAEPFDYTPPDPVRSANITQRDFVRFFYAYMKNDFLGKIATWHRALADNDRFGIESDECLELTRLHSMAVDYPKTGVPAKLNISLRPPAWPHWMERKRGTTYHSDRVLGQLFDHVQKVAFVPVYDSPFDNRILRSFDTSPQLLYTVAQLKENYDEAMRRVMAQHKIKTEFEIFSTWVLDHSKAVSDFKFHEEIGRLSRTLRDNAYESIVEEAGGSDFDSLAPFAVAAYKLAASQLEQANAEKKLKQVPTEVGEEKYNGSEGPSLIKMPMISFPWVLHETLGRIAQESGSTKPSRAASTNFLDDVTTTEEQPDTEKLMEEEKEEVESEEPFNPWDESDWKKGHDDPFKQRETKDIRPESVDETNVDAIGNMNLSG